MSRIEEAAYLLSNGGRLVKYPEDQPVHFQVSVTSHEY